MLNIALTGNVAAGKSCVVKLFASWGGTIIDADTLVHEAQAPGSGVVAAIAKRFGPTVLRSDGTLDRATLRGIVMADATCREDLNAIVHPVVANRRLDHIRAARARGDAIVVNDIPLLFEVLDPSEFDAVVLVDAPETMRHRRIVAARGLSPEEAQALIDSQEPSAAKRDRSDHVIDNEGSLEDLEIACATVWNALRAQAARAAANRNSGSILIFAPDLVSFVRSTLGTAARYAEAGLDVHLHIGSPSAPGLEESICQLAGIASAHHTRWDPESIQHVRDAAPATLVILADRLGDVREAWTAAAGTGAEPHAVLDVRPWNDVARRGRELVGLDPQETPPREAFRWPSGRPEPPMTDLVSPA